MSSELSQSQREAALKRIRTGESQHMVCTDLAARGIDIPALSHVFLFSASNDPETYVHRTGRTGRAGRSGKAISLVSTLEISGFLQALRINQMEAREISPPTEDEIISARVEHDFEYLESIEFGRDADVRDEFSQLAAKLSDEQVRSLAPMLLEHFRRPELINLPVKEIEKPPASAPSDYHDRGDQDRSRDRGGRRERSRGGRDGRDSRGGGRRSRDDRGGRGGRDDRGGRGARDDRGGRGARDDRGGRGGRDDRGRPGPGDSRSGGDRGSRDNRQAPPSGPPSTEFKTVCVGLGRLDGLDVMDIQSLLRRQGRAHMRDIGEIQMKEHESFIKIGVNSLENVLGADGKMFKSHQIFLTESAAES